MEKFISNIYGSLKAKDKQHQVLGIFSLANS